MLLIICLVLFGILNGAFFHLSDNLLTWISIPVGALLLCLTLARLRELKAYREELRRFLERSGWTIDPTIESVEARPRHAYNPTSLHFIFTRQRHQFVATKKTTAGALYCVYDEWAASHNRVGHVTLVADLQSDIQGWVRIIPKRYTLYARHQSSASVPELRDRVSLEAEPSDLPERLFTPDFVSWLLQQPRPPWIHLEGSRAAILLLDQPQAETIEERLRDLDHLCAFFRPPPA